MAEIQAPIDYKTEGVTDYQRRAIFAKERVCVIEGSVQSGKTLGCLSWLTEQAHTKGKAGDTYWWVAPVYSQAEDVYNRLRHLMRPYGSLVKFNNTKLLVILAHGARMEFKSAEYPDRLYGPTISAAVIDEGSRMRKEAFEAIRSRLTHTNGPLRIIGNVHGRKNWFYQLARLAEQGKEPDMLYARITSEDAVAAGIVDAEEVEAARRHYAALGLEAVFRQLYYCEAAEDGDNPFGLAAIHACSAGVEGYSSEPAIAAGLDLAGRGSYNINPRSSTPVDRDYSAVVMLDRRGHATLIDRWRGSHMDAEQRAARLIGSVAALADTTGQGDPIVEALQRRPGTNVEGFTFSDTSRQELLEHLALRIGQGAVSFPDEGLGSALRSELEAFESVYSRRGLRFYAPVGMHDDLVMALALAVKRMPWRRLVAAPVGVPQASRWLYDEDAAAYRHDQESRDPRAQEERASEQAVPVPFVVGGSGRSKWSSI